jgi:uncharacterized protein involved in propanediol utilization
MKALGLVEGEPYDAILFDGILEFDECEGRWSG